MCGAPAANNATQCEHCGARLATVACPSCFGLIFLGAKFCSHCGASVERVETDPKAILSCPRCRQAMEAIAVGGANLSECAKCEGLWVDNQTFQQICLDREKQAAVLGMPITIEEPGTNNWEVVRYVPCPTCKTLMNRVQFAQCSHVIVDVCKKHGTWFDKDELRKIIEFIRRSGLEEAHRRELDELQRQRSLLKTDIMGRGGVGMPTLNLGTSRYDGYDLAMDALSIAFKAFFE
jgi:Zn-finger nucleic acid-binding protein